MGGGGKSKIDEIFSVASGETEPLKRPAVVKSKEQPSDLICE